MKVVVGYFFYLKKLIVKVFCSDLVIIYINDKKEKRELMNIVIVDSFKVVKCVVYDVKKFYRFKVGIIIILRNIICKLDGIVVISVIVIFFVLKIFNFLLYMEKEGMVILYFFFFVDVKIVEEVLVFFMKIKVFVCGKII